MIQVGRRKFPGTSTYLTPQCAQVTMEICTCEFNLRFNFPLTLLAVFLISAMRSSNSFFVSGKRYFQVKWKWSVLIIITMLNKQQASWISIHIEPIPVVRMNKRKHRTASHKFVNDLFIYVKVILSLRITLKRKVFYCHLFKVGELATNPSKVI